MKASMAGMALVSALVVSGCANMTSTQQRVVSGGAMGAAGGALIGAIAGNAGMGAAVGAGAGVVGGYLYDQHEKSKEAAYERGVQDGKRARRQ